MIRAHAPRPRALTSEAGQALIPLARSATPFAALAAAAALVFAWLCDAVGDRAGITAIDLPVATWFASHRTVTEGHAGLLVARATGPAVLVALTLLISGLMWWRSERRRSLLLTASVVVAYAAGGIAKLAEHRARPGTPINLAPEGEPSFPSGHVLVVSTLVGVLLAFSWHRLARAGRAVATAVAVAAVAAVSLDRIVVGAHWLTDVVGSLDLGLVIVAIVAAGERVSRGAVQPLDEREVSPRTAR